MLTQAHAFVEQLADIYDFVSPCFPPKYDMFKVIFRKYHEHMAFMLDCVGACAESLANADILKARAVVTAIARLQPLSCQELAAVWSSCYDIRGVMAQSATTGTYKPSQH